VNAMEQALKGVPRVDGMVGATLVESSTGRVVGAIPVRPEGDTAVVAAAATDLVHVLGLMTANLAAADDLEELIITLRGHLHLVRPLDVAGHDGVFLLVTLDRSRANLALARHQLHAFESQIVG
jgi:hypothetical protein